MRIDARLPPNALALRPAPSPPPPPKAPDEGPQAAIAVEDLDLLALKYMLDMLRGESLPLMDARALELSPDTQRALSALSQAASEAPPSRSRLA